MSRFKLTLCYFGRNYAGFQVQPGKRTIQGEVEIALQKILGVSVRVVPTSRTDAKVHALNQVVHFDLSEPKDMQKILDSDRILHGLNAVLPNDITVLKLGKTSQNFHARKSALKKTYVYKIIISKHGHPLLKDFVWLKRKRLNLETMQTAARFLLGKHDFSSFCASDSNVKNKVREIEAITFSKKKFSPDLALGPEKYLTIQVTGTGFLKQMVRIMVGTLVAVGEGKLKPHDVKEILAARDRRLAKRTAPAHGLFLKKVYY